MSELRVEGLHAGYGDVPVLEDVALSVGAGEVVSVVGANGAGKTTLLRALCGLVKPTAGTVRLDGEQLHGRAAHETVRSGLVMVPEGRQLFPFLTVTENLHLGAYHPAARRKRATTLAEVLELFPVLAERGDQLAGQLSGGEQQMCALARGLMSKPKLLMLDEPSLGLAPIVTESVFSLICTLRDRGLSILLVEQNVGEALEMSSRGYVLEQGRVTMEGPADELLADEQLQTAYLGV